MRRGDTSKKLLGGICQAELAVIPAAIYTWRKEWYPTDTFVFVDNNPAKDALVRGCSTSLVLAYIVKATRLLCTEFGIGVRYERVASPSNLADGPSRADDSELLALGSRKICASAPPFLDDLVLCEF